jgi:hypothetical protein
MRSQSTLSFATAIAIGVAAIAVSAIGVCPANAQTGSGKPTTKPTKPKQIPGGANQVSGLNGKLGDMLWDGRWRFQVQEVKEVTTYTLNVPSSQQDYGRFNTVATEDLTNHAFTPKPGYTLIAVKCLAKNGQKTVQQLHCYPPDLKTALTDDQGNSYQPIVYDMQSDGAWTTKKLLPGSSVTMTVLFAVPPGTKLKDLVFSLKNWSDTKVTNLRIALPAPASAAAPATAATP